MDCSPSAYKDTLGQGGENVGIIGGCPLDRLVWVTQQPPMPIHTYRHTHLCVHMCMQASKNGDRLVESALMFLILDLCLCIFWTVVTLETLAYGVPFRMGICGGVMGLLRILQALRVSYCKPILPCSLYRAHEPAAKPRWWSKALELGVRKEEMGRGKGVRGDPLEQILCLTLPLEGPRQQHQEGAQCMSVVPRIRFIVSCLQGRFF